MHFAHSYRLLFACSILLLGSFVPPQKEKKVLIFSKTAGFRHTAGITAGIAAIQAMGEKNGFIVNASENAASFTSENLKQYDAVVFLSTTGDVLNQEQQQAFESYIKAGGGYAGIHAASDTEFDWPWYGELAGAYFGNHPPGQQEAVFNVLDTKNISTRHLPELWKRTDELYNFKWISKNLKVLISIDEKSYTGGKNGDFHPMSWYHEYDGGRAFYTAMGHDDKSFKDQLFLDHLLGGIKYVMGYKAKGKL